MNNLIKRHHLLHKLQSLGHRVEGITDVLTGKFAEDLISVNDLLCFILPLDNNPRLLSDAVLTDSDFIIACHQMAGNMTYYIIPCDYVLKNKKTYPLEYDKYKETWEYFDAFI